jgi:ribose transport system substrate-binding protein
MNRIASLLATCLVLSCCSVGQNGHKPLIAVVMKSLANGFFVTMAEGVEADHRARAGEYRLVLNGTRNENDLAQQVAIIDQMIVMHADAIVVAPADSKAIIPAVARAIRSGIKVINIDNRLDPAVLNQYGVSVPFVGPDNREGARKVGDYAAAQLKAGDEVAIIEGIPTAANSRARRMGLEDAATAAKLNIVSRQSADWDQAKAAEIAGALLVRYSHLRAIFCANDTMVLGVVSAVTQSGRNIVVTGFDNVSAVRLLLDKGTIVATADQHGDKLGVYGINYALADLHSQSSLPDLKTPVDLIHGQQVQHR